MHIIAKFAALAQGSRAADTADNWELGLGAESWAVARPGQATHSIFEAESKTRPELLTGFLCC